MKSNNDANKYAIARDGDRFGPYAVFVGDEVRFTIPDSHSSTLGVVLAIPSESIVKVEAKDGWYKGEIFRDRITAVFPKFK